MSSQARIDASRANGKLSRGPKTEDGKRRSSQNARRHGLLSKNGLIAGLFDSHAVARLLETRARFIRMHNPQGEIEESLVDRMAVWHAKLILVQEKEVALVNEQIRLRPGPAPEHDSPEARIRAARAVSALTAKDRSLDVLDRYAVRFANGYEQAFQNLVAHRKNQFCETNLTFPRKQKAFSAKRT
jgi:hypothetical protein